MDRSRSAFKTWYGIGRAACAVSIVHGLNILDLFFSPRTWHSPGPAPQPLNGCSLINRGQTKETLAKPPWIRYLSLRHWQSRTQCSKINPMCRCLHYLAGSSHGPQSDALLSNLQEGFEIPTSGRPRILSTWHPTDSKIGDGNRFIMGLGGHPD